VDMLAVTGEIPGATEQTQQLVKGARVGDANNYTDWDVTGHQTMAGNARPWRDQLTDSLNLKVQGTGISTDTTESLVNFDYNAAYNATPASADYLYCNVQLNHDRYLASSLYPHIHWLQAKNYAPNFLLEYRWQINGGAKVTSWTKLLCNTLAFVYSSGTKHQISYAAGIAAPVGSAISDIVQFRIYRDTGNVSTLFGGACPYNTGGNASAGVLAFDVHFQIDSLGSTDEYTK
jgi:hypothetical protein